MLKARIIPTLLWKNHGLVKGVGFNSWRRVGSVLPAIKVYNIREVDEMIVVDITAGIERREPDYESIAEFTIESFVPLTVGGGVRKTEDVQRLLQAGADKVSINSAAFENPDLVRQAANRFGSQCVVLSVDARRGADGNYECVSASGTQPTGREVVAWCREMEAQGVGEILLTSVERDGTMEGYDLDLIRRVSAAVSIPVIASGGAGNYEHMHEALTSGQASAVAAASIFHFTQQTPLEAKRYLAQKGIPVRNVRQASVALAG
jgi:imidazole glycerol-phosphate synthase subunit HisF